MSWDLLGKNLGTRVMGILSQLPTTDQATDDPSELGWHARLLLERYKMSMDLIPLSWNQKSATRACQAECIRKVLPSFVFRFVQDKKNAAEIIREFFAGLWGLNEESYEIINKQPELCVLKPQCEGGGNTIYGSAVKAKQTEEPGFRLISSCSASSHRRMAKEKSPTRIVVTC
ncbi:hypothetical protein SELMODRAFT_418834 [Selaginella moellendorffii]|uniref:Uncharacterized protein n=1 Tax=Selaginella moellendorffii TaxID=88036 RepID=D8S6I7_SELML|nr:hypothetical protein SELMODRAFT_418834 [Selaginella moellendorffii]